jgi:hypothetical protein
MSRVELSGSVETGVAYVTDYSGSDPPIKRAHSQMAGWAFCDALGLDVPRHHWFPEERELVVEAVDGEGSVENTFEIDANVASKIDRNEILDYISVLLLAGTDDLRRSNFAFREDGSVGVFDFDKLDQQFGSRRTLRISCGRAVRTVEALNQLREEPLNITKDSMCSRVTELANIVENSEHQNRIFDTVAQYDQLFPNSNESFEALIRKNVKTLSE